MDSFFLIQRSIMAKKDVSQMALNSANGYRSKEIDTWACQNMKSEMRGSSFLKT